MGVLMAWGPFRFETGAASYEQLKHRFGGRWKKHEIIGRRVPGQYLGPADETIDLEGTIYVADAGPGSAATVLALQQAAGTKVAYSLLSGRGRVFGVFRLEDAERTETYPLDDGTALKVTYSLKFCAHDDPDGQIWSLWP